MAQIGDSAEPPTHIEWHRFLSPDEFQAIATEASVIVAHAGVGSILTALDLEKPIVVMPRRAHLGEHRNDHQLATVESLGSRAAIAVVQDEAELLETLDRLAELEAPSHDPGPEYTRLLAFLRDAIRGSG